MEFNGFIDYLFLNNEGYTESRFIVNLMETCQKSKTKLDVFSTKFV